MTMPEKLAHNVLGIQDADGVKWTHLLVAFLTALFIAIPLVAIANAIIDRQAPVNYIEAFAPSPNVAAGKQVEIRFDVDRRRICQVIRIGRYVVDATGVEHSVPSYTASSNSRPGREVYDRLITVPETVPPGKAFYYLRIRYGCNFLNHLGWPITVESPHVALNILPPDPD